MTMNWQQLTQDIWRVAQGPLLTIAVGLLGLLLWYLLDLVKLKSAGQRSANWYKTAYSLVTAAEQWLPDSANDAKYDLVRTGLKAYFPALTEEQIKELVESAVLQMNSVLKSWPPPETGTVIENAPGMGP